MTDDDPFGLVELFMASPSQLRKMLADHSWDASGHCRSCRSGGTGSGRTVSCTLGTAAREAKRRLAARPTKEVDKTELPANF